MWLPPLSRPEESEAQGPQLASRTARNNVDQTAISMVSWVRCHSCSPLIAIEVLLPRQEDRALQRARIPLVELQHYITWNLMDSAALEEALIRQPLVYPVGVFRRCGAAAFVDVDASPNEDV